MGLKPGDIIDGKYRIERLLGFGGMGFVVAATSLSLDILVAIKLLRSVPGTDQELRAACFLREIGNLCRIETEHVPRAFDIGMLENGLPYAVIEYLEGRSLDSLIARDGPLSSPEAALYVSQACVALAAAHTIGIVHRDIKPSNLFLTHRPDGSPCIKVLDWGISMVSLRGEDATMPGAYAKKIAVDHRTDIWSLGVVLYELTTGRSPFQGATDRDVTAAISRSHITPPSAIREGIPPELDVVILRCLRRNPEHRFQSAGELAAALTPLLPPPSTESCEPTRDLRAPPDSHTAIRNLLARFWSAVKRSR